MIMNILDGSWIGNGKHPTSHGFRIMEKIAIRSSKYVSAAP
jgi:hypothetical protein